MHIAIAQFQMNFYYCNNKQLHAYLNMLQKESLSEFPFQNILQNKFIYISCMYTSMLLFASPGDKVSELRFIIRQHLGYHISSSIRWKLFSFQNNSKNLDLWGCLRRIKLVL